MTARLIRAQVGAGKTETIQNRLLELKRARPLAKVWVLLATERQVIDFRRRLIERASRPILFNVQFFNFYALYRHLLDSAGLPVRGIDETTRDGLIRALLKRMSDDGELPLFQPIAHTPGLIRVLGDFFYELKQNLVTPDMLWTAVQQLGASPKTHELAAVYGRYQALLRGEPDDARLGSGTSDDEPEWSQMVRQINLVDREGEGWLALKRLETDTRIASDVELLLVDGYDHFSILQADLLAMLAGRAHETLITLTETGDPVRAKTIGRRFESAYERLTERFDRVYEDIESESVEAGSTRPVGLQHLAANILRPNAPTLPPDDSLHLIEAPDILTESHAVMRRIKRLLLREIATRPHLDDILIALHNYPLYAPFIEMAGRLYNIPITLHYGMPIAQNPAIVALLNLLTLHQINFRKSELFDVLRSPYFKIPNFTPEMVDALESVSALVLGGRDEWGETLIQVAKGSETDTDTDDDERNGAPSISAEYAEWIRVRLFRFFDAITPPETGTLPTYILWLESLIGVDDADPDEENDGGRAQSMGLPPVEDSQPESGLYTLDMPQCIRAADTKPDLQLRDLAALREFKTRLRKLLEADALFQSLKFPHDMNRNQFMAEMQSAVELATVGRRDARDGRVLVTTSADARGLPHKHVFILGVSEGMLPAAPPEDRLLLDSERKALCDKGVPLLLREERADDDGIFYELINLASETLTLSRPYTEDGSLLPPSHLWNATLRVFDGLTPIRYAIRAVVPPDEVAEHTEAMLTVAALRTTDEVAPLAAWMQTKHADLWDRIASASAVEWARINGYQPSIYEGGLRDPVLIAHVAALVRGRTWSASQLNELGTCGFRFFSRRLLHLEALRQPDEGMDALQRGSIVHEILETVYGRLKADGRTIESHNLPFALEVLDAEAPRILDEAPSRYGFRPPPTWTHEKAVITRQLRTLIEYDFENTKSPAHALGAGRRVEAVEHRFNAYLPLVDGGSLRVHGVIDRIDNVNGQHYIFDYKTGGTEIPIKLMARGRNVQMAVYWLAAQHIGLNAVGGAFWHIGTSKFSGHVGQNAETDEALTSARAYLTGAVNAAVNGDFSTSRTDAKKGVVRVTVITRRCAGLPSGRLPPVLEKGDANERNPDFRVE